MARQRRPGFVFDALGHEVFITLTCTHCRRSKPLKDFGLRKMQDGKIRNCPWCRQCRAGAQRKIPIAEPGAAA